SGDYSEPRPSHGSGPASASSLSSASWRNSGLTGAWPVTAGGTEPTIDRGGPGLWSGERSPGRAGVGRARVDLAGVGRTDVDRLRSAAGTCGSALRQNATDWACSVDAGSVGTGSADAGSARNGSARTGALRNSSDRTVSAGSALANDSTRA